jgi:magnesium chelatase subunit D
VTWRWPRSWCWPRAPRACQHRTRTNDDENDAPEPPPPEAPDPDEHDAGPPPPQPDAQELQDLVLQAALAALPPGLLALLAAGTLRSPGAGGRAGAQAASKRRGRPVGSRRGDPRTGARLHLIDTLRAAAPWQTLRRQEAAQLLARRTAEAGNGTSAAVRPAPRVLVRRDDFRVQRLRERRETTTVFVVDASGSAALHRLAEAKGAVELLLAECYVRRDRVALIAFRGRPGAAGRRTAAAAHTVAGACQAQPGRPARRWWHAAGPRAGRRACAGRGRVPPRRHTGGGGAVRRPRQPGA